MSETKKSENRKSRWGSGSPASRLQGRQRPLQAWAQRGLRLWEVALETPLVALVVFVLAGTTALVPWSRGLAPAATAGAIADRDFIAPRDLLLPDDETTLARQQRSRDETPPVFDFDPGDASDRRLAELFAEARRLAQAPAPGEVREGSPAQLLTQGSKLKVSPGQAALLLRHAGTAELEEQLRALGLRALRRGIVTSKEDLLAHRLRGITVRNLTTGAESHRLDLYEVLAYPDEVRELLEAETRGLPGLSASERRLLSLLLVANLGPNLHLNRGETFLRKEAAALESPPSFVQVRRGQVIARQGDQLDASAVRIIAAYSAEARPLPAELLRLLATSMLLTGVAWVIWLSLARTRVAHHSRPRLLGESLWLLLICLFLAKVGLSIAEAVGSTSTFAGIDPRRGLAYSAPLAALGLSSALLFGRRRTLVLVPLFALLIGLLVSTEGFGLALFSAAGGYTAVFTLSPFQVKQRLGLARSGLVVGGVQAGAALTLFWLQPVGGGALLQWAFELAMALAGGLLSAAAASFLMPIGEAAFGIATDIKLAELANTNLPLLRRLAYEAPGSFQHSMMVANLAKQACEEIEADAALAYTSGLYHDVGKLLRPDYFVENQRSGNNPHDKLLPTMSALILISHIKDGRELAREHHLPQDLIDAVEQHHGTRLIKYFYSRAVAQPERPGLAVSEEEFRYPGPKPQTKVMGVLMLADAVEAASRTLLEPSVPKVRALIRTIVEDCLQDGQLDETDLTLADLSRISEAFLRVLTHIFHQRVDYPGFDFNAEVRAPKGRVIPLTGAKAR